MKVHELIKMLQKADPDMDILIPVSGEFDGFFHSPCLEESGVAEMGLDEEGNERRESFMIVPCGFFQEHDGPPVEMN